MRKVLIAVLLLAATWSATISAAPTKTQRELAERLYQQGYQKGSSGDYKTAIELFKKALELNPAHFMAAFNMGGAYEASGDKQRALEQYLATAVLKPTFIEAYNQAGTLFLLFKRDYDAAIAQFRVVLTTKNPVVVPRFSRAHSLSQSLRNLAIAYAQKHWYGLAQGIARSYLGDASLESSGRRVMAIIISRTTRDMQAALTRRFEAELRSISATLYGGRPTEALVRYRRVESTIPQNASALDRWDLFSGLAMGYALTKDFPKAEHYFRQAAKVATQLPFRYLIESNFNLACALSMQRKIAPALAAVEMVLWIDLVTKNDTNYQPRRGRYSMKLASDSTLANVRRDPRFAALLARYR